MKLDRAVAPGHERFGFRLATFFAGFVAVALYIAIRVWRPREYGLWYDEVFSLRAAESSWSALLQTVANDLVHPPLSYALLKLWVEIGGSGERWLELLPILFSLGTLVPMIYLARELRLTRAQLLLAVLLMAVNSYMVRYAQEVRMYSMVLFFAVLSMWVFIRTVNSNDKFRGYGALIVANTLMLYTQYFGLLVMGAQLIFLLLRRRRELGRYLLHLIAVALLFTPWLVLVLGRLTERRGLGENLGWLEQPGIDEVVWFFATLHGLVPMPHAASVGVLLFGSPLALWLLHVLRRSQSAERDAFWLLFCWVAVPIASAFLGSRILPQSIWGERYLIIVSVPYFLMISVAVLRLRPAALRVSVLILILAWAATSALSSMATPREISWADLATGLKRDATGRGQPTLYTLEGWVAAPLEYQIEKRGYDAEVRTVANPREITGNTYWVAYRNTTWKEEVAPELWFASSGCSVRRPVSSAAGDQVVALLRIECDSSPRSGPHQHRP